MVVLALLFAVVLASLPRACTGKPNIILILADDMEASYKLDYLSLMPNVRTRLREQGVFMANHVAAQPLCGPSRASLLAGRYPHNTHYVDNDDLKSIAAWKLQQGNTIGTWLTTAGYHTAYLGKYVNGLEEAVPRGWNHWGGFRGILGTYNYYNSTPYNVTFDDSGETPVSPITWTAMTGVHQADFLGTTAVHQMQIGVAKGRPFFVHVNPTMIHYG